MGKIRIPHFPEEEITSELYEVRANGEAVQVLPARVSAIPFNTPWPGHQRPLDQTELAGFVSFEGEGTVSLSVKPLCRNIKAQSDIKIRPLSRNVTPSVSGDEISFTLPSAGSYTLEIDGFHQALHIFYNPLKDFIPSAKRKIIRYGNGVHHIGHTEIEAGTTVIIEAGAVVYGSITAIGSDDVEILGYGIIDGSEEKRGNEHCLLPYFPGSDGKSVLYDMIKNDADLFRGHLKAQKDLRGCIRLYACGNARVEGVILRDSSTFALLPAGCSGLTVENIKTIGMWRYNSDGIDLFNCRDVLIGNCFLRNFDDCMVIKGYEGWDSMNNENITVEGCVIWCDWGRALEYGAETNAPEYAGIVMRDCDIIHGSCIMMDIQTHNRAEIHGCVFENIRAEYCRYQLPEVLQRSDDEVYKGLPGEGQPLLIEICICNDDLFCVNNSHGRVYDIHYKDIRILADNGADIPVCRFTGIDGNAFVSDVTIDKVSFNGQPLTLPERALKKNGFARNIIQNS